MSLKPIKNYRQILLFLLLSVLTSLFKSCTKLEDPLVLRKEAITNNLNNEINADTLRSIVNWMQGMGTRFALSDSHRDVAMKIKNRFVRIGYSHARIDSFIINKTYRNISYQQWQYNVIASIEGTNYPDSVCIIGGHYDNNLITGDPFAVVPGANDNASGVAAALEIARVMKKSNYSPGNTIEFVAFGSEELGLYGSFAYAAESQQNLKKIKLMINNDMIAYQPGTDQTGWTVNIIDYDNSHNLRSEAEKMCSKYTTLGFLNDNTHNKQSDSYPFFINGYKAIFFFSGNIDPVYHTLSDIPGNCNFEYCREIVKISCALLVNTN